MLATYSAEGGPELKQIVDEQTNIAVAAGLKATQAAGPSTARQAIVDPSAAAGSPIERRKIRPARAFGPETGECDPIARPALISLQCPPLSATPATQDPTPP